MDASLTKKLPGFALIAATAIFAFPPISAAQGNTSPNLNVAGNEMAERMELSNKDAFGDKDQAAAFQAFAKEAEPAKKIQMGSKFLQKYPKGPYVERVDVAMMNAYHAQQDWKDTYAFGDSALALNPDDVDALTTIGWTIPHVINPSDADADQQLDKAETFAKHAIEVLAKLPKPLDMTDAQFAASKQKRTFQAHSALGLVYFRRGDYDKSANELELATKDNPATDQTDLFILGTDLQNLSRFADAAEAFGRCAQTAGVLQRQCKQGADTTKGQAAVTHPK
jgi:tetratricopeptide (TPR) repeat protein